MVVAAPHVNRNTADQVLAFVADHAPDVAAGVVDLDGLRRFRGGALDVLDADHDPSLRKALPLHAPLPDLYSDLNQWMLKVLLAAELPPGLVSAPRERSRDASQLARNAGVSVMSASRLVRQLKHQGHLEEKGPWLQLVRKEELLERWSAASDRPATELRMRFRPGSDGRTALGRLVQHPKVCLALFSAADALGLGLVRGVPPYVYARRLEEIGRTVGDQLVPAEAGEAYHVIVRQPRAVESVFRGMVRRANEWVSDVIQVWLDVSFHPSRGEEQAARIYHKLLAPIIDA
ncbi:MAG TPA: hypothetical protein VFP90_15350 [Gemmatimonadaceae bacterium]|nr:hypothetical protein [Gemmatimonadaceae bacterium]